MKAPSIFFACTLAAISSVSAFSIDFTGLSTQTLTPGGSALVIPVVGYGNVSISVPVTPPTPPEVTIVTGSPTPDAEIGNSVKASTNGLELRPGGVVLIDFGGLELSGVPTIDALNITGGDSRFFLTIENSLQASLWVSDVFYFTTDPVVHIEQIDFEAGKIPEPSSALLSSLALICLSLRRKR